MSTFLSKLFKPKWQSKSASTRIEAIRSLDTHSEEEQKILQQLAANDTSAEVRAQAIARIQNSQILISLLKDASAESKPLIEQRLHELAQSQSLTLFDLIVDTQLLTDMIVRSNSPDTFITGLGHIEDPKALLRIAQEGKTSRIRQAAAELIETEEQLSTLTTSAKGKDKSVYQIAKTKLTRIKEHVREREARQQAIEKVIQALEEHAQTESTQQYEAKLENLEQRWQNFASFADAQQQLRFDKALEQCRQKRDDLVAEQRQREEQERLEQVGGDEQEATLLTLSQTLERFRQIPASIRETSALDALIKTQENRWLEATRHSPVERNQNKHYQLLMTELRHYHKALKTAAEKLPEIESELKKHQQIQPGDSKAEIKSSELNTHSRNLRKLLDAVDWPRNYALPEVLDQAAQALGETKELKQDLAANAKEIQQDLDTTIQKLDKALDDKQLKSSNRHLKHAQKLLTQLSSKQGERYHNQLTLRVKQVNDLRDWQGFAAHPRQELLCEAMEKLIDQHMEPREKADKIKAMQKEWKTLGGARDQELWQRFKQAADKAYEPCKAFFEEQSRLKDTNIERRRTLIGQLESFIQNNDWESADWKAIERINREARADWKSAYPVDHKQNKPLQTTFNALLSQLDKHLDGERSKNLELKQAVVSKAEALVEHDDLDHAMANAKELQKEWQTIGITEHRKDRALWKQFRTACDAIFARRDQMRESRRQEIDDAIQSCEQILADYESRYQAIDADDAKALNTLLGECRKSVKQLPNLPKKTLDTIQGRYEALMRSIKAGVKQIEHAQERARWKELARKAELCRRSYAQTPSDDALQALDDEFASQTSLSPDQENRMKSLWISVKAGQVHPDAIVDEDAARDLCIRCEIAAGMDSPEADRERRMQLQVSRLSEGMTTASEHLSRESQLSELLESWYASVGLSVEQFAAFDQRIAGAMKHLFGEV